MKTKKYIISNMKRAMLCFIFIPYFLSPCHAQINEANKKRVCNSYMRANYIFEGKVISSKEITIKTGDDTYANYASYLIEVQTVIKGNIQKGTIEIIQIAPGGHSKTPDGQIVIYMGSDDAPRPPLDEGLYFSLNETKRMDSSITNSNAKSLWFDGGISITDGKLEKQASGLTQYFSTLAEFYDYIRANYGIKIDSAK